MLGLITGSGFYSLAAVHDAEVREVTTPYGTVALTMGRWHGVAPVTFLPRHGSDHSVAPHAINYRANIWALREVGATQVIATAVSGAISPHMEPGAFVVIDDFIDFTSGRPSTFFDEPGNLTHTDMTNPYDPELRSRIVAAGASTEIPIIDGGTYCATNGPRFESKAEIEMMRRIGGDLVGMTGCPEVVLATELGLPYASVGVISNWAAGLGERELSVPEIMQVLTDASPRLEQLLGGIIDQLGSDQ